MGNKSATEQQSQIDEDTNSTSSNDSELVEKLENIDNEKKQKENVKALTGASKKFQRYFRGLENVKEEEVAFTFACAYVGEILLQGRMFVTTNYFAFYSNIFGYVTKVTIPIVFVDAVSKERIAKILPNAIGIQINNCKHTFGGIINRQAVHDRLLKKLTIIKGSNISEVEEEEDEIYVDEDVTETSSSSNNSNNKYKSFSDNLDVIKNNKGSSKKLQYVFFQKIKKISGHKIIFGITIVLLVFLYISAAFLMYKISLLNLKYNVFKMEDIENSENTFYVNLLKWQSEVQLNAAVRVNDHLNPNLEQLEIVINSLKKLSSILSEEREKNHRS